MLTATLSNVFLISWLLKQLGRIRVTKKETISTFYSCLLCIMKMLSTRPSTTFKYWPQTLLQTKQPSILSGQRVPHINQRATKIQGFSSLSVDVSQALLHQDKPLHKVPPWDKTCPPQLSLQAPGLQSSHGLS